MANDLFLAQFRDWIGELRGIADKRPGTGACTVATAMQLWLWTLGYLQRATDPDGMKLFNNNRQGVTFPLADALCWLLASRQQILDVLALEENAARNPDAEGLEGTVAFLTDLCHVQAARAAGEVGRIAADLIHGYARHPSWDDAGACGSWCGADELDELEGLIPGIAAGTRAYADVIECDGSHARKAGPCVKLHGIEPFTRLRARMDGCLTGSRLAKDRAARALTGVMIPEAPDYPA
jgi:hypothetical protein